LEEQYIKHGRNVKDFFVDAFFLLPLSSLTGRNPFHILRAMKINILPDRSCMAADEHGGSSCPAGIAPVSGEKIKKRS